MNRYIGFLRAINITGRTIKMERLRELIAALGFDNVATFIASGNIIFDTAESDSEALEAQIEDHLRETLGYEVITFLRTPAEVAAIAAREPFDPDEAAEAFATMVAFLKAPPTEAARQKLMGYRSASDDFHVHGREVYWLRRSQVSERNFAIAGLEKALSLPATIRGMNTVRRLAAKYPPA
jgi:uncharacterized protein (DUF1697 family)